MGCQGSSIEVIQHQDPIKRDVFSNLSKDVKQRILDAIQHDNLSEFVKITQQRNAPINSEISQSNLFWMASHFCCRWDSQLCLQHILKTAYLSDPTNYIYFVNQQTFEGYTCLHLCGIWAAEECFNILMLYGGLNLTIKDKTNSNCLGVFQSYKRKQMKDVLQKYRQKNIQLIPIDHQKISSKQLFTKIDQKIEQSSRNIVIKKAGMSQKLINNSQDQDQYLQKVSTNLKKLYEQKQKLRAQLKKKQQEKLKKLKQEQQKHKNQQQTAKVHNDNNSVDINQNFNQNKNCNDNHDNKANELHQKKIVDQLHQKQVQLQKQKQNLVLIQKQKNEELIKQQILKANQYKAKNQQMLRNRANQLINQANQKKKKQKKVVQQKTQAEPLSNNGQLPAELLNLYNQAKSQGIFTDKVFPSVDSSLGTSQKTKNMLKQIVWLRPNSFFKGDYQLFNGIDPNDIKQGSLGVCYMLATLSTLAQNQQNIRKIFVFHDKQLGFYVLRFSIHGIATNVVVDDFIPCNKSTKSPIFAKPIGNQLWVCLLQKAWAKCIGNYMNAQSMSPNHLMEDLTMAPSFGAWFKDSNPKTKDINDHLGRNHIVVLTSDPSKKIQGIVNNHAYSLLNHYEHQGVHLYKIRNPWGRFEWNGQYGQKSSIWTSQLKKKVGFIDADDGIFFLSESQLLDAFCYYSISIIQSKYIYDYVKFQTSQKQSVFYMFELEKDQQINLRVSQPFDRMLNDKNYKYSPVIFEVGKINNDGSVQFLTQGDNPCYWGAKSVHADPQIMKKYTKGKYLVRVEMQWVNPRQYNKGVFSIYSSSKKNIVKLDQPEGQKLWIKLLISFAQKNNQITTSGNIKYSMKWMRGQMVCYGYASEKQTANQFKAKWGFTPKSFKNCQFGYNYAGQNNLEYKIGKGPSNANVGTLRRNLINQTCSSGSVYISASQM